MAVLEEWDEPGDKGIVLGVEGKPERGFLELYDCASEYDLKGISLQFKVADLSAFLESLPSDIVYDGPRDRPWGARYAYLSDPAGILVIAYDGDAY